MQGKLLEVNEKLKEMLYKRVETIKELQEIEWMIKERIRELKELEEGVKAEWLGKWRNKEVKTKEEALQAANFEIKTKAADIEEELRHLKEAEKSKFIEKITLDAEIEYLRNLIKILTKED